MTLNYEIRDNATGLIINTRKANYSNRTLKPAVRKLIRKDNGQWMPLGVGIDNPDGLRDLSQRVTILPDEPLTEEESRHADRLLATAKHKKDLKRLDAKRNALYRTFSGLCLLTDRQLIEASNDPQFINSKFDYAGRLLSPMIPEWVIKTA